MEYIQTWATIKTETWQDKVVSALLWVLGDE